MSSRLRLTDFWLVAVASALALGALVDRSPRVAYGAVLLLAITALLAQVADLPATRVFAVAVVMSAALVDLPGKLHSGGRFSSNAALTVVFASFGALVLLSWRRSVDRRAMQPLLPFAALFSYGLVSMVWGSASVAAIQNVLVLFIFVVSLVCGIEIGANDNDPGRFAARLFGLASVLALTLYAASVAVGGLGAGSVVGNRSFGLIGLVVIAWAVAGWRYEARFGRALTAITGALIMLSLSRTAFAAALVIVALAWINPRSSAGWLKTVAAFTCVVAVGYVAVQHVSALHNRIYAGDVHEVTGGVAINLEGRSQIWATTWDSYLRSPIFGHGVGSADTLITRVYTARIGHPHNDYLRLLHDYGLLGFSAWIIGYAWLLRRTWGAWQATPARSDHLEPPIEVAADRRRIHAAAFLSLIGVAVAMSTDNSIVYMFVMAPLGVIVGLSLGLASRSADPGRALQRAVRRTPKDSTQQSFLDRPRQARVALHPSGSGDYSADIKTVVEWHPAQVAAATGGAAVHTKSHVLLRGFGLNLVAGVAAALFGFGFTVVLTHALPVDAVGVFFQVLAVFSILIVVAQLGASATIVKTVSSYRALGRVGDLSRGIVVAVVPALVLSTLMALAMVVFAAPIATWLAPHGDVSGATTYVRVLAPFIPFAAAFAVILAASRGLGTMVPTVVLDGIAKPGLRFLVAVLALFVLLSPAALAALWAAPLAVGLGFAVVMVIRLLRVSEAESTVVRSPYPTLIRDFWSFTAPQWAADVFQLAVLWLDVVLVGALASSREAGIYGAASRLVVVGTLGLAALTFVLGPEFGGLLARGEFDRVRSLYRLATLWLTLASLPVFLVMTIYSSELMRIFGPQFRSGAASLSILSIAMLINVATGPALLALLMGGRSRVILVDTGVAFAANLSLNLALIPLFGMNGAAVAWAVSIVVLNLLAVVQIRQLWDIRAFDRQIVLVVAGAVVCFGIGGLLVRGVAPDEPWAIVGAVAVDLTFYVAFVWRVRSRLAWNSLVAAIRVRRRTA